MKRTDYFAIVQEYIGIRERFQRKPFLLLAWIGMLSFIFLGLHSIISGDNTYSDVDMSPLLKGLVAILLICIISTMGLFISFVKNTQSELYVALYLLIHITATLVYLHSLIFVILIVEQINVTLTINAVCLFFVIIFMIWCIAIVVKKVKNGDYRENSKAKSISKKVLFWGVSALPIMPFISSRVSKYQFNQLADMLQAIIMTYMVMWLWLVIIYTFLARNFVFIVLEVKYKIIHCIRK